MKLDRDLQRAILQRLADVYPGLATTLIPELNTLADEETLIGNMLYLEEHDLIVSGISRYLEGRAMINSSKLKITARGLDFLADDGGLSATRGVVTIKLHDDTLKSLIESKILASDLPQPDKNRWIDQLRTLPVDATKHLTLKLLDLGLSNAPAALAAIGGALGLGATG
jgi:hypothetical protein